MLRAHAMLADGTIGGSFRAMYAWGLVRMRPLQVLFFALEFEAFGRQPLGYHLTNAAILVLVGLLLYAVLRWTGVPRVASVAIALVYSVLPHYSTNRAWYAATQAPLMMALYLTGVLCYLRSLRGSRAAMGGWLAASALATLASGLAYELAMPLVVLHPLLGALALRDTHEHASIGGSGSTLTFRSLARGLAHPRVLIGAAVDLAVIAALVVFKLLLTTRISGGSPVDKVVTYATRLADTNLWHYGLAAPVTVARAARDSTPGALLVALVVAAGAAWYLARIGRQEAERWPPRGALLAVVGLGGIVLVLGTVIVVPSDCCLPEPFDRNNRVAIAGAMGVALALVALLSAATDRLAARRRVQGFAVAVGIVAGGGTVTSAYLTSWWAAAYRMQLATLADVRAAMPSMPPHSVLLLDGACSSPGAAFAFHSQYDLRSALALQYGDTTLRGDVVTPSLAVRGDGVHTFKYGEDTRHDYARLLVFDARRRVVHQPRDSAAARAYFDRFNPTQADGPCPSSPRRD